MARLGLPLHLPVADSKCSQPDLGCGVRTQELTATDPFDFDSENV